MKNFERSTTKTLKKRLIEPVKHLIVIAGPRQCGKTTAVHQTLEQQKTPSHSPKDQSNTESYHFHAVDAPEEPNNSLDFWDSNSETTTLPSLSPNERDEKWLIEKWQQGRNAAKQWWQAQNSPITNHHEALPNTQQPTPFILVFDEIQNLPNWSSTVKGLWDQDRKNDTPMHVIVLGSAPLMLQQGISESLLGRYELIRMTHWSYQEMKDCFSYTLDQYIYFGGYPGPARMALEDEARWRSIVRDSLVEPNLVKDIMALTKIEKPAVLRQLFELGCRYSGQIVAVNKLLVQIEDAGNTTTLSHYLTLLKAAGLLAGLDKFAYQAIRQRKSPPKLNVLNTAFLSTYSGYSFSQAKNDTSFWGHLVESCIGAHLLNASQNDMQIFYWRDNPLEVDFVLYNGQKAAVLEIKSTKPKVGAKKGLQDFIKKHPKLEVKPHLIGGDEFSLAEALSKPVEDWLND